MRKRKGFTLVELLVVIGIIALLISILMPSLARARGSANLVACQSNFKQIYTALSFYANENKGFLPFASLHGTSGNYIEGGSGTNERVFVVLSELLGTKIDDVWRDPLNPVFRCTEAPMEGTAVWCPPMIRTIQFHPRAMPGYDQLWHDKQNNTRLHPQRKLAQIRNASEKVFFWEGASLPGWNATSEPESISLDTWRSSGGTWGHAFYNPVPPGQEWEDMSRPIDVGQNRDENWWVCGMRFRHMKNTSGPIGYFDGHVEAKRPKEIQARDVCITPP